MMTIIGLAQNFVGSNNLNLLQPLGQFGTRLHGGKDSASPRYIFTMLRSVISQQTGLQALFGSSLIFILFFCSTSSPLARLLFPQVDDNLLKHNFDDNQRVEPEWYVPIIPTVLINGAEGIGTGWASKIPNYDVRELISNILRMINGEEPQKMVSTVAQAAFSGLPNLIGLVRECPPRNWASTSLNPGQIIPKAIKLIGVGIDKILLISMSLSIF